MLLASLLAAQLASAIDPCAYTDAEAARAVWTVSEKGCAPAEAATVDGRQVLALRCNFAGTDIGRGSWDRAVTIPMGQTQGVEFDILCADTQPVASFSLYLHSGDGWYHAAFSPHYQNGWNRLTLTRAQMKPDGKPGPWGAIDKVRLSAWRGGNTDTTLYLRNLRPVGVLGEDARVLLLEGTEGDKNVGIYARHISTWLDAQDIRHATLRDVYVIRLEHRILQYLREHVFPIVCIDRIGLIFPACVIIIIELRHKL